MRDDDKHRTNGHRPNGMRARPTHLHAVEEQIDLVAVQADDELINALAAGMSVSAPGVGGYDADDHVAAILAAWRAEVDEEPIPELVDIDTAIAAIRSARPRSRARHLAPVAAAAAFVVLAISGVSVGSSTAEPGDALWGVSKVLYSERAGSIEAAARVETSIDKAKKALIDGQPVVASQELQKAAADLAAVRPQEGQAELSEVQDFLKAKADETPQGTPTDPGQPLNTDRRRKVPEGAGVGKNPAAPKPAEPDPSTVAPASATPDPAAVDPRADPRSTPAPVTPSNPATTVPTAPSASATPTATPEGGPSSPAPTTTQGMGSEGATDSSTPSQTRPS